MGSPSLEVRGQRRLGANGQESECPPADVNCEKLSHSTGNMPNLQSKNSIDSDETAAAAKDPSQRRLSTCHCMQGSSKFTEKASSLSEQAVPERRD